MLEARRVLEPGPVTQVQGDAHTPFQLRFPATGWRQLRAGVLPHLVSRSDRAWVLPAADAVVFVKSTYVPAASVDLDGLIERFLEAGATPGRELLESVVLEGPFDAARRLHLRDKNAPRGLEYLTTLWMLGDRVFEITAHAPRHRFPKLRQELEGILDSFTFQPPRRPSLPEPTLSAVNQSTVLLVVDGGDGSGFIIQSGDGRSVILTNDHVLRDSSGQVHKTVGVVVHDSQGRRSLFGDAHGETVLSEPTLDLAVVRLRHRYTPALPVLELRHSKTLREQEPVVVVGYPFGGALAAGNAFPAATVNGGWVLPQAANTKASQFLVDVGINPGNSGGPVVDARGRLPQVNPPARLERGALAGRQHDEHDALGLLQVDRPVFDLSGALVGLTIRRVSHTNMSLTLTGEQLREHLRGGIRDASWRFDRLPSGRCEVQVRVVLEDPLGTLKSVSLRLGPDDARWTRWDPRGIPELDTAVLTQKPRRRQQWMDLRGELPCADSDWRLQLEVRDAQGARRTLARWLNAEAGEGVPVESFGRTGGTYLSRDWVPELLTFAMEPLTPAASCTEEAGRCERECAGGQAPRGTADRGAARDTHSLFQLAEHSDSCASRPSDCMDYARLLWNGPGSSDQRGPLAMKALNRSCDTGKTQACGLALSMVAQGKSPGSFALVVRSLESRCLAEKTGHACVDLARMHARGLGLPRNTLRAAELLALGCELRVPSACSMLPEGQWESPANTGGRGLSIQQAESGGAPGREPICRTASSRRTERSWKTPSSM